MRYPTLAAWDALIDNECAPLVEEYLERPYDPFGRFALYFIHPLRDDWNTGSRTVTCGLSPWEVSADAGVVSGRVVELDPSPHFPVASCVTETSEGSVPIDCAELHWCEIAGQTDVIGHVAYPDDSAWTAIGTDLCGPIVVDYIGRPTGTAPGDVVSIAKPLSELAWAAGGRGIDCGAVQLGMDGSLVDVTGSVAAAPSDREREQDAGVDEDPSHGGQ